MSDPLTPASHDDDAVEYVLGTLPADEREAFERRLVADAALATVVRAWEERLAPFADGVAPVEPRPETWAAIERALDRAAARTPHDSPGANVVAWPGADELVRLRRSRAAWRGATAAAMALAAALALFIAADRTIFGAPPATGLVAVVNRSGELPALIVRVDPRAGTVQVRSLATETPADRSLELWSIVGREAPRSLGVVTPGVLRVSVPEADRARLDGATIAVTVEPTGGSKTGGPTGPVVYSGRLVPETP